MEETKVGKNEKSQTTIDQTSNDATFAGVDEDMELDQEDQNELMKFETVQQAKEIEFDKIKLSEVC